MTAWLWIVGGHNGAGKTTVTRELLARGIFGEIVYLNPDDMTAAIMAATPDMSQDDANLQAARFTEDRLDALIEEVANGSCGASVLVETVLSSPKYRPRVDAAQKAGMKFGFLYVVLSDADLAVLRVRDRVASGGHDVPEGKIRDRRRRSLDNVPWFLARADVGVVYCNDTTEGGPTPLLVISKQNGVITLHQSGVLPEVEAALGL